jgi:hypothetical protein
MENGICPPQADPPVAEKIGRSEQRRYTCHLQTAN